MSRQSLERIWQDVGDLQEAHREARDLTEFGRYSSDPAGFCREVLSVNLFDRQVEIAESLRDHPLVTVKGCNASGKDYATAGIALWWALCRKGTVLVTGPTDRQVREIVMGHISSMWKQVRDLPGELYAYALRLDEGGILCFTSTEASRLTGFHDARVLAIMTEAQAVPEFAYEAMLANAVGEDDRVLLLGNPTVTSGRFYQTHRQARWQAITISALDLPNVKNRRTEVPGLMTMAGVKRIRDEWGESSGIYGARVLAQFPAQAEEGLFDLRHIESAQRRWAQWSVTHSQDAPMVAVDPARFGTDATAVAVMRGPVLLRLSTWNKASLTDTASRVEAILREYGIEPPQRRQTQKGKIVVDSVGLGAGVTDILRDRGYRVKEFKAGSKAKDSKRFVNTRAECFWELRDMLERDQIALLEDRELVDDLMAISWAVTPEGKVALERKEDLKSRLGRSPDRADAVVMCVYAKLRRGVPATWGYSDGKEVNLSGLSPEAKRAYLLSLKL